MEVTRGQELLMKLASGELVDSNSWSAVRDDIVARLESIAHHQFPVPNLPPPPQPSSFPSDTRHSPAPPSSPLGLSSQEANKENVPAEGEQRRPPDPQPLAPGELPRQLAATLTGIKAHLQSFSRFPPHTIQRLAELVLLPRCHYTCLASYLHAVDRVVQVTSGTNRYPLPPAVPDMSALAQAQNDVGPSDPAAAVSWGNISTAPLGSDEALGGALLTPIPWLTGGSPESNGDAQGAQIHSESTETISGPNGMGSIETVSVSVNGVPSTGHARGVTQGELLRQEQRAGVVPVSQLPRAPAQSAAAEDGEGSEEESRMVNLEDAAAENEEKPHARGPDAIGVDDTGPQGVTTSYLGEGGVDMQAIDVEAAVGRKHDEENASDSVRTTPQGPAASTEIDGSGTKREAEDDLAAKQAKKRREEHTNEAGFAIGSETEAVGVDSLDEQATVDEAGGFVMGTDTND